MLLAGTTCALHIAGGRILAATASACPAEPAIAHCPHRRVRGRRRRRRPQKKKKTGAGSGGAVSLSCCHRVITPPNRRAPPPSARAARAREVTPFVVVTAPIRARSSAGGSPPAPSAATSALAADHARGARRLIALRTRWPNALLVDSDWADHDGTRAARAPPTAARFRLGANEARYRVRAPI